MTTLNVRHMLVNDAYKSRHQSVLAKAADLTEQLGQLREDSARLHWGHVGDLGRIEALLTELSAITKAVRQGQASTI